ncbi:MAG: hypothetical protein UT61_C0011G0008 [Candidatus Woesebacteria bacterium GW2011_GWA1_39_8]|uniref:Uncharacterized protein n=1 Tax=Candidatus Woesebacteria bacterium GW2011_GWA1_39_8 TaxID=1618552 RepID=A0A0G0S639_9BACT|nr:MAG: hypothetical protein UT61_C0011G0008 [Candidatus Woesebacteria bacterium GW2011_GWA1_39_8]
MVTKTLKGSYDAPRRSYAVSLENYMGSGEEMISESQCRTLKNLILQRVQEEGERERFLANLPDMTRYDAEESIFNFLKSSWS